MTLLGYTFQCPIEQMVMIEPTHNPIDSRRVEDTHKTYNEKLNGCISPQSVGQQPKKQVEDVKRNHSHSRPCM